MTQSAMLQPRLHRFQHRALLVGVGGLLLSLVGAYLNLRPFFQAYLMAYVFWLGIALGCLAILMLHHLVGGAWGALIRRILEAGTRTLPLMALLMVPLFFGLHEIYLWARPEAVAGNASLQHKSLYLNIPFFMLRTVVYFVAWLAVATCLNRWSLQQDQAHDQTVERALQRRLQLLSGPGLVVYGLTMTFAAIDWVMSLDPDWYSTIYGMLLVIGQLLAATAFAIVVTALLANAEPFSMVVSPAHLHDLGNLLLTFIMLWAYIAFSQFLIIWAGNLPEEILWYVHRTQGGWQWIGLLLILFHFALPFFFLLSRRTKRSMRALAAIAVAMLVMHRVDLLWIVMPGFSPSGLHVHWLDIATLIGIGGIWVTVFVWQLRRRSLLPLHDPRLQGVTRHG